MLSNRELEKEIARVRPEFATVEKASYVAEDRVRLELGLSEREMLKLRRVQDLLSQARRRPVSPEESIEALTSEYLKRHDSVEKAKRHQVKKGSAASSAGGLHRENDEGTPREDKASSAGARNSRTEAKTSSAVAANAGAPTGELVTRQVPPTRHEREPIPAAVLHQVNLRDQRRCTETLPDGSRCNEARWIDIHHIIQVSQGGTNALDNLTTLCSAHHRLRHEGHSHTRRTE